MLVDEVRAISTFNARFWSSADLNYTTASAIASVVSLKIGGRDGLKI